jgi:NAD(P)H dehydrogenase (quinone)
LKISIIYFSATGNTKTVAKWIQAGAESVADTEVRLMNIAEEANIDVEFVNASAAIIFGTPTYVGNMCWQLKQFFDTNWDCKLGGKIGAAFSTENCPHGGGGELAIMTIVNHMLVKGMLAYSSGAGCGRPFIHIGPTVVKGQHDDRKEICIVFGERIANKAHELFSK